MRIELLIIAALLVMYYNHLQLWFSKWTDFDSFYSIGILVLVFIFFFLRDHREELAQIPHQPSRTGIPIILGGLVLYYVGTKADIAYFYSFSLPLLIAGIVLWLYGRNMLLKILPLLLFFTIALPVLPVFRVTMPFQLIMANVTSGFLNFIGLKASYSGSLIVLEDRLIDVEAGCAGVTSLYSLFVATLMYVYYKNIKFLHKFYLVLASLVLSVVGNFTRITITSLYILYNGSGGSYYQFHENLGIAIFVILLGIVFITANVMEETEQEKTNLTEQT